MPCFSVTNCWPTTSDARYPSGPDMSSGLGWSMSWPNHEGRRLRGLAADRHRLTAGSRVALGDEQSELALDPGGSRWHELVTVHVEKKIN